MVRKFIGIPGGAGAGVTSVFGQTGVVGDLTGDVTTSGSVATTLATVNSNVGSFTNANVTVNGKGQVTAAANGSTAAPPFPVTVAGTVTSGGVPYFSSTTVETSSALLASNSPVLGGGAGAAPKTATFLTSDGAQTLTVGVASGGNGTLALAGNTSGTATFAAPATAGTTTNAVTASNCLLVPVGATATPALQITSAANGFHAAGGFLVAVQGSADAFAVSGSAILRGGSGSVYGWTSAANTPTGTIDTGLSRKIAGVVYVGTGASGSRAGLILSGNTVFVTSNFTTSGVGTALENITGLTFTFPATAINWNFHAHLIYSQAVGNVAVAFGIKAATNAPTNIAAWGTMQLSTTAGVSTYASGVLPTLTTTTGTTIVSGTPLATGANYVADLYGTMELGSSANTVTIMVSTATAADLVTVLRGSYFSLTP